MNNEWKGEPPPKKRVGCTVKTSFWPAEGAPKTKTMYINQEEYIMDHRETVSNLVGDVSQRLEEEIDHVGEIEDTTLIPDTELFTFPHQASR